MSGNKVARVDGAGDAKAALKAGFASVVSLPSPEQKTFADLATPLVLRCNKPEAGVEEVCTWVADNLAFLEASLSAHGAILFRDFNLPTAAEFDRFVGAFPRYADLPYDESLSFAVRLHVVGRVSTTNEGKKGGQVFHHEQAQTPLAPTKIFFYCERPADVGGGTAICPSTEVLQRLEAKFPEAVRDCEVKGIKYTSIMASNPDPSKGVGRSWRCFFSRDTKDKAEARMKELGYTWEWLDNGEKLRATSPALPAVQCAPGTTRKVFFNQIVAQVANALEFGGSLEELHKFLCFGDGSAIPDDFLTYARQCCDDTAVELEWQHKDVALLDNYLVMHARRQFDGKRRVLASLAK